MAKKLGMDAKLYIADAVLAADGDPAESSWNEVDKARDVNLNLDAGEADVTARDNDGWRATRPTLRGASLEFELVWDPDDEQLEAIRDAYLEGTGLGMAVMDGDIEVVGNEGFVANVYITGFNRSEPLEEGITVAVTAKPESYHQWYEVESG